MGNFGQAIKRFFGNKNTVTILGVLAGIAVLYIGYNIRVKQAVEPQSVPYAKKEIVANTLITRDMIGTVKISKSMVDTTANLVTSAGQVIGKYVSYTTTIPEGSLFYKSQLMTEEQLPNYIIKDIPKCYTVYSLPVNLHTTYANSIMPDDYIDLYFKAIGDDGQLMVSKMIESIQVKAVRDSKGKSVFSSNSSTGAPSELIFAVPNSMFLLLKKADYISTNSIEVFPVPRNQEYTDNPNATQVTSDVIIDLINSKSTYIESDEQDNECTTAQSDDSTSTTTTTTTTKKAATGTSSNGTGVTAGTLPSTNNTSTSTDSAENDNQTNITE